MRFCNEDLTVFLFSLSVLARDPGQAQSYWISIGIVKFGVLDFVF